MGGKFHREFNIIATDMNTHGDGAEEEEGGSTGDLFRSEMTPGWDSIKVKEQYPPSSTSKEIGYYFFYYFYFFFYLFFYCLVCYVSCLLHSYILEKKKAFHHN